MDHRTATKEKKQYNNCVVIQFQENAWFNEGMMLHYLKYLWNDGGIFCIDKRSRLLICDAHCRKTTETVKQALKDADTAVVMVTPGTTSKTQPFDLSVDHVLNYSKYVNCKDYL